MLSASRRFSGEPRQQPSYDYDDESLIKPSPVPKVTVSAPIGAEKAAQPTNVSFWSSYSVVESLFSDEPASHVMGSSPASSVPSGSSVLGQVFPPLTATPAQFIPQARGSSNSRGSHENGHHHHSGRRESPLQSPSSSYGMVSVSFEDGASTMFFNSSFEDEGLLPTSSSSPSPASFFGGQGSLGSSPSSKSYGYGGHVNHHHNNNNNINNNNNGYNSYYPSPTTNGYGFGGGGAYPGLSNSPSNQNHFGNNQAGYGRYSDSSVPLSSSPTNSAGHPARHPRYRPKTGKPNYYNNSVNGSDGYHGHGYNNNNQHQYGGVHAHHHSQRQIPRDGLQQYHSPPAHNIHHNNHYYSAAVSSPPTSRVHQPQPVHPSTLSVGFAVVDSHRDGFVPVPVRPGSTSPTLPRLSTSPKPPGVISLVGNDNICRNDKVEGKAVAGLLSSGEANVLTGSNNSTTLLSTSPYKMSPPTVENNDSLLLQLPSTTLLRILGYLSPRDLGVLHQVCKKRFSCLACDDGLWKELYLSRWKLLDISESQIGSVATAGNGSSGDEESESDEWAWIYSLLQQNERWKDIFKTRYSAERWRIGTLKMFNGCWGFISQQPAEGSSSEQTLDIFFHRKDIAPDGDWYEDWWLKDTPGVSRSQKCGYWDTFLCGRVVRYKQRAAYAQGRRPQACNISFVGEDRRDLGTGETSQEARARALAVARNLNSQAK